MPSNIEMPDFLTDKEMDAYELQPGQMRFSSNGKISTFDTNKQSVFSNHNDNLQSGEIKITYGGKTLKLNPKDFEVGALREKKNVSRETNISEIEPPDFLTDAEMNTIQAEQKSKIDSMPDFLTDEEMDAYNTPQPKTGEWKWSNLITDLPSLKYTGTVLKASIPALGTALAKVERVIPETVGSATDWFKSKFGEFMYKNPELRNALGIYEAPKFKDTISENKQPVREFFKEQEDFYNKETGEILSKIPKELTGSKFKEHPIFKGMQAIALSVPQYALAAGAAMAGMPNVGVNILSGIAGGDQFTAALDKTGNVKDALAAGVSSYIQNVLTEKAIPEFAKKIRPGITTKVQEAFKIAAINAPQEVVQGAIDDYIAKFTYDPSIDPLDFEKRITDAIAGLGLAPMALLRKTETARNFIETLPKEAQNAGEIRKDTGELPESGKITEGVKETGGYDIQQIQETEGTITGEIVEPEITKTETIPSLSETISGNNKTLEEEQKIISEIVNIDQHIEELNKDSWINDIDHTEEINNLLSQKQSIEEQNVIANEKRELIPEEINILNQERKEALEDTIDIPYNSDTDITPRNVINNAKALFKILNRNKMIFTKKQDFDSFADIFLSGDEFKLQNAIKNLSEKLILSQSRYNNNIGEELKYVIERIEKLNIFQFGENDKVFDDYKKAFYAEKESYEQPKFKEERKLTGQTITSGGERITGDIETVNRQTQKPEIQTELGLNVKKENVTEIYNRYYNEAKSKGMNQKQAESYAKEKLKSLNKPQEQSETTTQEVFQGEEGKGFGTQTKGQKELFESPTPTVSVTPQDQSFIDHLSKLEEEARARIEKRQADANKRSINPKRGAVINPFEDLADYAIIGASKIAKGIKNLADFLKFPEFAHLTKDVITKIHTLSVQKYEENKNSFINLNRLKTTEETKKFIKDNAEKYFDEIREVTGETMSNNEIVERAKTAGIINKNFDYEHSLKYFSEVVNLRQEHLKLAETGKVTKEYIDALKRVKAESTFAGRLLQSHVIEAEVSPEAKQMNDIISEIIKNGNNIDDVLKAAAGVNFKNQKEATEFYRKFVKPKMSEILDEYRYANMLSSPLTHIINTVSNLNQMLLINPVTKLLMLKNVPAYFKGMTKGMPIALTEASRAMKGEKIIERPDIKRLRTNHPLVKWMYPITNAMEASDVFFRTLIKNGELEEITAGKTLTATEMKNAEKTATEKANKLIFREMLDPENKQGQGAVLSAIDKLTVAVISLRKVPTVKWFIPFVQTPMSIAKQGIEYSPFGFTTLYKSENKQEQFAKATIGSIVTFGAGLLALAGLTTWAAPRKEKEKEAFYASGRQPYSIKIGDKWVSFSKIGPLAFPIAIAAAIKYNFDDNPKSITQTNTEKTLKTLSSLVTFWSDQSYLQGIGDFFKTVQGDESALKDLVTNIPRQLVPLGALQTWITNILDPIYRKPERDLSPESLIQNIQKGIPFLSQYLPARVDSNGNPIKKENELLNAISPVKITTENFQEEAVYQQLKKNDRLSILIKNNPTPKDAWSFFKWWNESKPSKRQEIVSNAQAHTGESKDKIYNKIDELRDLKKKYNI